MLILGEVITLVGNLVLMLNHAVAFGFSTDSSVDVEFFVCVCVEDVEVDFMILLFLFSLYF